MTLAEWRRKVWENAEAKGWHERERSWPEIRILVVSELAEAAEEFRAGRMTIWFRDDGKPEGFPIEVADAGIRLLEYCETIGLHWDDDDESIIDCDDPPPSGNVLAQLDDVVASLYDGLNQGDAEGGTWRGLLSCFALARWQGFDLLAAIEQKHTYNLGRPYKHGKLA